MTVMANAYYLMELSATLDAGVSENEIAELQWHLGLQPSPAPPLQLADAVNVFQRGPAYRRGTDPDLFADLVQNPGAGNWVLTAWQEPDPDELESLELLFLWLAARTDTATRNIDGSVCLGRMRFCDEMKWTNTIMVFSDQWVAYPRIPGPLASELLPAGSSAAATWEDFAVRLAVTLSRLREDECVSLENEQVLVQFLDFSSEEIVGHIGFDDASAQSGDSGTDMRQRGWREPEGLHNWHRRLPRPISAAQLQGVAEATVSALRDVVGVRSPQDLSLSAFGNYLGEKPDVSAMGLTLSS